MSKPISAKFDFKVSPEAWCEHCGELAVGRCAHGHDAVSVSAEDERGVQWCPDCLHVNDEITEKQRLAAWALVRKIAP